MWYTCPPLRMVRGQIFHNSVFKQSLRGRLSGRVFKRDPADCQTPVNF